MLDVGLKLRYVIILFAFGCPPSFSEPQTIEFAVPTALAMPLAEFRENVLIGGIVKDIDDAIARKLNRTAHYVSLPRKRVYAELETGTIDGLCYSSPSWFETKVNWSRPLIPNDFIVVSAPGLPPINSIHKLNGEMVGTVLGYSYPDLETLKSGFIRDDAPSVSGNLQKLMVHRFRYAAMDSLSYDFAVRSDPALRKLSVFTISNFVAQCAFSMKSKVPFSAANRAIDSLIGSGEIERILARYR
jgi:polar amino acid transport system substrate-binding protein